MTAADPDGAIPVAYIKGVATHFLEGFREPSFNAVNGRQHAYKRRYADGNDQAGDDSAQRVVTYGTQGYLYVLSRVQKGAYT